MSNIQETELYHQVHTFVCQRSSAIPEQVTTETSLLHDLGVDGEDASSFITDFSKNFGVKLETFTFFDACFHSEGPFDLFFFPLSLVRLLILKIFKPERYKKMRLTVLDLFRAAKAGEWLPPESPTFAFPWEKTTFKETS